ncbi:MAG: hypothetical protein ACOYUZ_04685 [Patescibacteria group bacterium]
MFPGFGKNIPGFKVKNKGGIVQGPMQLMPWGDLILLEYRTLYFPDGSRQSERLPPGTILRPNRKLAGEKNPQTTHIVYHDAYEAERGAKHAVRRYGIRGQEAITEAGDLNFTKKALREYVVFLLRQGPHLEHVLRDLFTAMMKLAKRYGWMIDEDKKKAAEQMLRGLIEKDSLGRKNLPAAAMSMGGAIWHLLEREEAIQWLSMRMDQKAVQTERLIAEHMELYQQLWDMVGKDTAIAELTRLPHHETQQRRLKMRLLHGQLEAVRLRPFIKNARHTVRDIGEILDVISHPAFASNQERKAKPLYRLREGIRWVFVLNALQREIIFPLSFLLDDLERKDRLRRRGTDEKPTKIVTAMAPDKFADLDERLQRFEQRLDKCQDEIKGEKVLGHPVKDEVLGFLELTKAHLAEDDWRVVKNDLDTIAGIL